MVLDLKAESKEEAIKEIAKNFFEKGYVKSAEDFEEGLKEREAQGSTALGESVAIPHSKNATALELEVDCVFARKKQSLTTGEDFYHSSVYSFTKQVTNELIVSKNFLNEGENILMIDDFLAKAQNQWQKIQKN